MILFSPEGFGGLYKVSSVGGTPTEVTKVDASRFEWSHRWPMFLPDGKHFVYLAANFSGQYDKNEIFIGQLDSDKRWPIVSASSNAAYAEPGYLLYIRDNALIAQKLDLRQKVLVGPAQTLSDAVQYFPIIDLGVFDVAANGTIVAQTGTGAAKSQLMRFDRNGKPVGVVGQPGPIANVDLSPDGRKVVVDQTDLDGRHINIWIHDLVRETPTRLTFSPAADSRPIWSPDGKSVTFGTNRTLRFVIYQKNADGSGTEQVLADLGAAEVGAWNWSRDGKYLLMERNSDLVYLSQSDRQPKPLLQTGGSIRNAQFSPDARWVAYSSNETGNWEVYVMPFPSASSKWQVSAGGGEEPRWRRDGKELFYLSSEGKLMSVAVKADNNFEVGPPVALFQTHARQPVSFMDAFSYDVTADGQKFLIDSRVNEANAEPLSVILNWRSEAEK